MHKAFAIEPRVRLRVTGSGPTKDMPVLSASKRGDGTAGRAPPGTTKGTPRRAVLSHPHKHHPANQHGGAGFRATTALSHHGSRPLHPFQPPPEENNSCLTRPIRHSGDMSGAHDTPYKAHIFSTPSTSPLSCHAPRRHTQASWGRSAPRYSLPLLCEKEANMCETQVTLCEKQVNQGTTSIFELLASFHTYAHASRVVAVTLTPVTETLYFSYAIRSKHCLGIPKQRGAPGGGGGTKGAITKQTPAGDLSDPALVYSAMQYQPRKCHTSPAMNFGAHFIAAAGGQQLQTCAAAILAPCELHQLVQAAVFCKPLASCCRCQRHTGASQLSFNPYNPYSYYKTNRSAVHMLSLFSSGASLGAAAPCMRATKAKHTRGIPGWHGYQTSPLKFSGRPWTPMMTTDPQDGKEALDVAQLERRALQGYGVQVLGRRSTGWKQARPAY
eukprot:361005-Chlamydomonas_euryale.AAC.12